MNENVLQSMLGPLYLKYGSLSDFEELGEGGFATVHRAKYKHSNGMTQIVAVKQLLKARVSDRDDLRDFIAVRQHLPIMQHSPHAATHCAQCGALNSTYHAVI